MRKKKNSKLVLFSLLAVAAIVVVALVCFGWKRFRGENPKGDWWKAYPTISAEKCTEWNGSLVAIENSCGNGMIPGAKIESAEGAKVCCMNVDADFNKAFQPTTEEARLNVRLVLNKQLGKEVEITAQQQNADHMFGNYTSADGKTKGKFYAVKPGMEWMISAASEKPISCALGEQHGYPQEWITDCIK